MGHGMEADTLSKYLQMIKKSRLQKAAMALVIVGLRMGKKRSVTQPR